MKTTKKRIKKSQLLDVLKLAIETHMADLEEGIIELSKQTTPWDCHDNHNLKMNYVLGRYQAMKDIYNKLNEVDHAQ